MSLLSKRLFWRPYCLTVTNFLLRSLLFTAVNRTVQMGVYTITEYILAFLGKYKNTHTSNITYTNPTSKLLGIKSKSYSQGPVEIYYVKYILDAVSKNVTVLLWIPKRCLSFWTKTVLLRSNGSPLSSLAMLQCRCMLISVFSNPLLTSKWMNTHLCVQMRALFCCMFVW